MEKDEKYLDELLEAASGEGGLENDETDVENGFGQDLSEDDEAFLKEFEQSLDGKGPSSRERRKKRRRRREQPVEEPDFVEDFSREEPKEESAGEDEDEQDLLNILKDISDEDESEKDLKETGFELDDNMVELDNDMEDSLDELEESKPSGGEKKSPEEGRDDLDVNFEGDLDLSDIEELALELSKDGSLKDEFDSEIQEQTDPLQEAAEEEGDEKKKGFFARIGELLFKAPEDEEDKKGEPTPEELEAKAAEEQEKEEKKRLKKEEKEQKKKEKAELKAQKAQEKAAKKAAKPKKEKKPKEPDNSPKLPLKPVLLIFFMAASLFALIYLGSNTIGYDTQKKDARQYMTTGDYEKAYTLMEGLDVKKKDRDLYEQTRILASVQHEISVYETCYSRGLHEDALDALIRGVGRYHKYSEEADTLGIGTQLAEMEVTLEQYLTESYQVTKEQALEIYRISRQKKYTLAVIEILRNLGLE